jgi:hypothetical protein
MVSAPPELKVLLEEKNWMLPVEPELRVKVFEPVLANDGFVPRLIVAALRLITPPVPLFGESVILPVVLPPMAKS